MTTTEQQPRKPADRGIRPQWLDRRYDLVSRKWHWRVPSFTNTTDVYTVHYDRRNRRWECTCGDCVHRERDCKHIELVLLVITREKELARERRERRAASTTIASVLPAPVAPGSLSTNKPFSVLK